ncbi:MAG: ABC transporter ATP-binding protein [Exilispira sp.]
MLELNKFSVFYGKIDAVKSVSLSLQEKEVVTVIGVNGAGKSSLLHGILGIVDAKGMIFYLDKDISKMPYHERVKSGIILCPEGRRIFSSLTVEENLKLGSFSRGNKKKQMKLVYDLFPKLFERKKQISGYLSGGEQQMLAIGRALMADPKLLMLDEPSLGLAPIIIEQVYQVLSEFKKLGISILLIEQNAYQALSFADRAYIIENGRFVIEGESKKLLKDDAIRKAYLGI